MLFYVMLGVVGAIVECTTRDLPSYFPRCNIDDPNLNECILKAARTLRPQIRKGIKEIKLPAFDPLEVSGFEVYQNAGSLRYNVTFINTTVHGFDSFDFEKITYDPKTLILQGTLILKDIFLHTNYISDGWFIYFPVIGKGSVDIIFNNINGTFEVTGELIKRKGREYYTPIGSEVRMKVNGFSIYFNSGLFDNDPELTHITNELFNINGQEIVDGTTPVLEALTEGFLLKFVRTLTRLIPYNKLFPHS